jgi:hypothetical protein
MPKPRRAHAGRASTRNHACNATRIDINTSIDTAVKTHPLTTTTKML